MNGKVLAHLQSGGGAKSLKFSLESKNNSFNTVYGGEYGDVYC